MLFADNEKLIFSYDLGGEKRYADPLEVRRKLIRATAGEINDIIRDSQPQVVDDGETPSGATPVESMAALDAREKLVGAARVAFDLPPLDQKTGEGVPESEVHRVLNECLFWLKKNAN